MCLDPSGNVQAEVETEHDGCKNQKMVVEEAEGRRKEVQGLAGRRLQRSGEVGDGGSGVDWAADTFA